MSGQCHFFRSSSAFARQICQTVLLSLSVWHSDYFTSHCGCLCFNFPKSRRSLCPPSPSLSSPSESLGQVNFLCFHCPPYQFLFCPSSGCSWFSLMCWGNAAPRGIPPPPPPFLISLSPTDPESHYPSPLFVLHDSLVQFMSWLAQFA